MFRQTALQSRSNSRFLSSSVSLWNSGASGPSYDPDAEALFARFTTPPTTERKEIINTLIVTLKTAGVWAKLDALYLTAAADAQAARRNWISDTFNLTAASGPTFTTDRGYTGDGSAAYLSTGYDPSVGGLKYQQNSAHLSAWIGTEVNSSSQVDVGVNQSRIISKASGSTATVRINSGTNVVVPVTTSVGWLVASRQGSTSSFAKKDQDAVVTSSLTSAAISAGEMTLLSQAGSAPSSRQIRAASFGSGLSQAEAADFYTALLTYMQAIGAS